MSGNDEYVSNRPRFGYNFNSNDSVVLETRFLTTFSANGFVAANDNWQLFR